MGRTTDTGVRPGRTTSDTSTSAETADLRKPHALVLEASRRRRKPYPNAATMPLTLSTQLGRSGLGRAEEDARGGI